MTNREKSIERDWARFRYEYLYVPPDVRPHTLTPGDTRSGKTNLLQMLLKEGLEAHPDYGYVWFDLPKVSESLGLSQFAPLNYIIPKGRDLQITLDNKTKWEPYPIEKTIMKKREDIYDPWPYLKKNCINVICIEPFIIKAKYYGPVIARTFEKLIYRAIHNDVLTPLTVFIDEINNVAPNRKVAYDKAHIEGSLDFLHNCERLAGHSIQLNASTQFYTEIPFPTRKAMSGMQFIKRGSIFPIYDEPRLWEAPKHWQRLQPSQVVIRWKDHTYSESDLTVPYYEPGSKFGHISYIGEDITAKYFEEKDPTGPLPCDECQEPHEARGENLICISRMRIMDISDLREKGCPDIEEITKCHAE
jgi:hypothetical protein